MFPVCYSVVYADTAVDTKLNKQSAETLDVKIKKCLQLFEDAQHIQRHLSGLASQFPYNCTSLI